MSSLWTAQAIRSRNIVIHLNDWAIRWKKLSSKRLELSMHWTPRTKIQRISCYTKLLVVVKGLVFQRFGIRSNGSDHPLEKNCHPFWRLCVSVRKRNAIPSNDSGYPFQKIVSHSISSSFPFKTIVSRATVQNHFHPTNLSENVRLNNSSTRCLPSPHEFSRYIFCWIAFFAFLTFDHRYQFYSGLRYNIQQIPCFDLFVCKYQTLLVALRIHSIYFAYLKYHNLPSPLPGKK